MSAEFGLPLWDAPLEVLDVFEAIYDGIVEARRKQAEEAQRQRLRAHLR